MSVVKFVSNQPYALGVLRLQRQVGETQEQFDSTKDQATFTIGQNSTTLVLDGRVDDSILAGIHPYSSEDQIVSDIRQLKDKAAILRQACLQSEEDFSSPEVDLGTGHKWLVIPQKDESSNETYQYNLSNGPGAQRLVVRLNDQEVLDVGVCSHDSQRGLYHSMYAKIDTTGTCNPYLESVSWPAMA